MHRGLRLFERRLVIEVGGGQHAGGVSDLRRDPWLQDQGFRILRFWNNEVLNDTENALEAILCASTSPLSRHAALRRATLSHKGGGELQ